MKTNSLVSGLLDFIGPPLRCYRSNSRLEKVPVSVETPRMDVDVYEKEPVAISSALLVIPQQRVIYSQYVTSPKL
ncbi:hypothetical protein NPIL_653021 [Nephila pilipes]|uniref:Uncharacterized protein n=1 Tax=Nephila pilipes TaxID=299642 RepID=A0A8X6NM01_NEPPI|nr:hypothetical protein NPIL_653021 [Nephila pilipes]